MKKMIFLFIMFAYLSCSNKPNENFEDISKIQIGMSYKEVQKIMRNNYKDRISASYSDTLFIDRYEPGFGASDYFGIVYSEKDSIVVEINLGD
jgi:hypothetical protein